MEIQRETQITMCMLMSPDKANHYGFVHGGEILKMADELAYVCASKYCEMDVVTLSVDRVLFRHSVKIGEILTLHATINYTGNTSIEVGIRVITENIKEKTATHTNNCYFTMVALDKNGKPTKVPEYIPKTDDEIKRFEKAIKRRELRLKMAELE